MSDRVKRYQAATAALDFDALAELRHPDFECIYPQSGERFCGHDNWVAAHRDYAKHFGSHNVQEALVRGGEQKTKVATTSGVIPFVTTPIIQIADTGDLVTFECSGVWPDGKLYHYVMILEYRDGLVWRETDYFAEPFQAPAWRAEFSAPIE